MGMLAFGWSRSAIAKRGIPLLPLLLAACTSPSASVESDLPDSEKAELINYIRSCWYWPGSSQSRDFLVTIVMHMNRDATLQSAEIAESDQERMGDDPAYQGYALSALAAAKKCGEGGKAFPINRDRDYEIWSEIRVRFAESELGT